MIPLIGGVMGAIPVAGGAPLAFEQSQSGTANQTGTVTATYDSTPTEGNLLVACMWSGTGNGVHNWDTLSGWTKVFEITATFDSTKQYALAFFYKIAGSSEATGVSFSTTEASGLGKHLHIMEFSGNHAVPLDVFDSRDETDDIDDTASTGHTETTTVADEVIIACCVFGDDDFTLPTTAEWTSGYTMLEATQTNPNFQPGDGTMTSAYRIVTATGIQNAEVVILGGGGDEERISGIATFKAA